MVFNGVDPRTPITKTEEAAPLLRRLLAELRLDMAVEVITGDQFTDALIDVGDGAACLAYLPDHTGKYAWTYGYEHHYNGSFDEPPSSDYIEDGTTTNVIEALSAVVQLAVKRAIEQLQDGWREECDMRDMEEGKGIWSKTNMDEIF